MRVAELANTAVVSKSNANDPKTASQAKGMQNTTVPAKSTGTGTSPSQEIRSPNMPLIRKKLNNKNLSSTAEEIIMASWRSGTGKQYHSYLERWEKFCSQNAIVENEACVENGIEFLASLYKDGLGYSAINTARSALSSALTIPGNVTFGNHPLVARFLKGVFELRPSLPKYNHIWDVSVVLRHLKTLQPICNLDLKALTLKLTMLLCLLTGQRCQTLSKLDTTLMQKLPGKYVFTIGEKLKTTKPGRHIDPIELTAFEPDINLCVVTHLDQYLIQTEKLRGSTSQLLISYVKPHKAVSNTTIGKWCKAALKDAGIDVTEFTSHSGRSASTSYASQTSLTLKEILKAGGWSNAQTFAKHYQKPIIKNFGSSLLEHFHCNTH